MYCKFHIAQIIIIKVIENIIKGSLEVFLSVYIPGISETSGIKQINYIFSMSAVHVCTIYINLCKII